MNVADIRAVAGRIILASAFLSLISVQNGWGQRADRQRESAFERIFGPFGGFQTFDDFVEFLFGSPQIGTGRVANFRGTGAKIAVRNPDAGVRYELTLNKTGKFSYERTVRGITGDVAPSVTKVKGRWQTNGKDIRFSGTGSQKQLDKTSGEFLTKKVKIKSRIYGTNSDKWIWKNTIAGEGANTITFVDQDS